MSTEETVVDNYSTSEGDIVVPKPKKTKGQLFKEQHGYSRTMDKLMRKYSVGTVEAYRRIRKMNRKLN